MFRRLREVALDDADIESAAGVPVVPPESRRLREVALDDAETWDGVTDRQIYERDGWICQIPGCELGLIDLELKYPHPLSAEADHIVPLSLGGADTAPNKRASHKACNERRGNRMRPDDVPVITVELAPLGLLPARLQQPWCPVHNPRKPVTLPWPKVAQYRPCRWCGDQTLCARPSRSPWTVCQACSRGKCVKCGAGMAIVVNSSPPEQRVCQRCQRHGIAVPGVADQPVTPKPVSLTLGQFRAWQKRST